MPLRPIHLYPDPVLRRQCPPVTRFDDDLRRLAADMIETMHAAPGIGLAASQVGVETRLAVVDLTAGEDPEAVIVLANPRIVESAGSDVELEGCLSIPDLTEKVTRPTRITVEAEDLEGTTMRFEAEEWLARAICHEIDHLDGVLFTDRLRGLRKERARRALKRLRQESEVMA
jgi:peptide deformylase